MAVGLSLLAGLGTGFGGLIAIAVVRKLPDADDVAGLLMGLAAGVLGTPLSFLELVDPAWQACGYLVTTLGGKSGRPAACSWWIH